MLMYSGKMLAACDASNVLSCQCKESGNASAYSAWLLLIIIGIGLVYLLFKKRKFLVDNLKWIAGTVFIAEMCIRDRLQHA